MGHEGQGVARSLVAARAQCGSRALRQPGGEESLNVAAAAAICLHASAMQRPGLRARAIHTVQCRGVIPMRAAQHTRRAASMCESLHANRRDAMLQA